MIVLRHLRKLFKVDSANFMMAICGNDALRELSSPGKNGSFFQLTQERGSLTVETESIDQWNYRFLGLSESGKGDYEFPQVLSLLFSVLKKTIQKNESSRDSMTRKANDTIGQGLRAQDLSIQSYTERIFKYSNCSHSCFILAHVYIDRYLVQPGVHLSCLNVHR
ncbi:uncharacterized protein A4U43_C07F20550 [Asparagus officinalis]|uniref:Uncharacterized protein n=1 Tax=Asparagus officinalis TaxID=4686 RepID=A0A5P1EFE9_ASPOF|nr:uncharacterized protein A4U43_C07F20550 [Asparagus officinalis]